MYIYLNVESAKELKAAIVEARLQLSQFSLTKWPCRLKCVMQQKRRT